MNNKITNSEKQAFFFPLLLVFEAINKTPFPSDLFCSSVAAQLQHLDNLMLFVSQFPPW